MTRQNLKIDICLFILPSLLVFSSAKKLFHFRKYVFLYIIILEFRINFDCCTFFHQKRPLWLNVNTQTTSFIRNLSRLQGLRCQSFLAMGLGFFPRFWRILSMGSDSKSWVWVRFGLQKFGFLGMYPIPSLIINTTLFLKKYAIFFRCYCMQLL